MAFDKVSLNYLKPQQQKQQQQHYFEYLEG